MSLVKHYVDKSGWTHEQYETRGKRERKCSKQGISITHIENFMIVKCTPRSVISDLQWFIDEISNSRNNNADIKYTCDVYIGEYIRVDISVSDQCYNVFNENNMVLFSDKLTKNTVQKIKSMI
jgi:hypothetical protein